MVKKLAPLVCGLGLIAVSVSGCYTVLQSPFAAKESSRYAEYEEKADRNMAPTIGKFNDGDQWGDPYGVSPYGRQGFPVFGYNSQYGAYGMLGGMGNPYGGYGNSYGGYGNSYGYGPYGYGYDPYYQNADGVYVPPGYELVTTSELQRLRAGDRSSSSTSASSLPTIAREALRLNKIESDKETWQRRSTPRAVRTVPATRREPASAPAAKSSTTKSSGDSKAAGRRSRR